jgi:hypothetical protein
MTVYRQKQITLGLKDIYQGKLAGAEIADSFLFFSPSTECYE